MEYPVELDYLGRRLGGGEATWRGLFPLDSHDPTADLAAFNLRTRQRDGIRNYTSGFYIISYLRRQRYNLRIFGERIICWILITRCSRLPRITVVNLPKLLFGASVKIEISVDSYVIS